MRGALVFLAVVMTVFCTPRGAEAQDTLSVAARLAVRQPFGVVLRLNTANELVTGVLADVDAGSLYLVNPPRTVPLNTITDAWLQRRSTSRGGKVGAIIGASAGSVLFAGGIALLSGLCEYDCGEDIGAEDVLLAGLIGAAAGAGSGYLIGSLIGASIPRWERLTDASTPPTIVEGTSRARREPDAPREPDVAAPERPRVYSGLSAFTVNVGANRGVTARGTGLGFNVSYVTQLSRHLAIGPEFGRYDPSAPPIHLQYECGQAEPCELVRASEGSWGAGAIGRFGIGADRALEPYATFGVGLYKFPYGSNLGGYSTGAGLRFRPGHGTLALSADGRWHSNFTRSGEEDLRLGFYTFTAGLSLLR